MKKGTTWGIILRGAAIGMAVITAGCAQPSPATLAPSPTSLYVSPPATFQPLRTLAQVPAGHFLTLSLHLQPASAPKANLPPGGPFMFIWRTAIHRQSDAYFSIVPAANFETGQGTRYFARLNPAGAPTRSPDEAEAKPVVTNGTLGGLSMTGCPALCL
jgi:hypothetical protein